MSTRRVLLSVTNGVVEFSRTCRGVPVTVTIDTIDMHLLLRAGFKLNFQCGKAHVVVDPAGRSSKHAATSVAKLILGAGKGRYVHFKDGNSLNLRRENLQSVTYGQVRLNFYRRRPMVRQFAANGKPAGIFLRTGRQMTKGQLHLTPQFCATFSYGRKKRRKMFAISRHGIHGAAEKALAWRVQQLREHGIEPIPELLAMLERAKRMARAGGGFEEIYGGNAEYENSKVVAREVAHWAQPYEEAA